MGNKETSASREELAAICAGFHNLFALLVRELMNEESIDIAELLTELDRLKAIPGQHPMTQAVQMDAGEMLLGLLVRDPESHPEALLASDLAVVAPLRQSVGFDSQTEAV